MITFLEGILAQKEPTRIVVNVNGVGYEVLIPLSSYDKLPKEGAQCQILTHHHVREDAQILFGFCEEADRKIFIKLLGINGIGPKLAISVLSGMSVGELKTALVNGDIKRLNNISGVGKKTAQRMVLELSEKFSESEKLEANALNTAKDTHANDAVEALVALGYQQSKALKMVNKIIADIGPETALEDIIRHALANK